MFGFARIGFLCLGMVGLFPVDAWAENLGVRYHGAKTEIAFPGGPAFHVTDGDVTDARLITVPGADLWIALWNEADASGRIVPHYALSADGASASRVRRTSYEIQLRAGAFDPLGGVADVAPTLSAPPSGELFIVQFFTQPFEAYLDAIRDLGGRVYGLIPNNAQIVRMEVDTLASVERMGFVRWIGPYHPAYKLEGYLRDHLDKGAGLDPQGRYFIQVFEPDTGQKQAVADRIAALGGAVHIIHQHGPILQATLTRPRLLEVIRWDEVAFVSRVQGFHTMMDNARIVGGTNFVESVPGFTGAGVNAEVMDNRDPDTGHTAFQNITMTCHNCSGSFQTSHATSVFGIVFWDGTATPGTHPDAKGVIPDANGLYADGADLEEAGGTLNRYFHTQELVEGRGLIANKEVVFQTNSFASAITLEYLSTTADLDLIVEDFDLLICQAQGNCGNVSANPVQCDVCNDERCAGVEGWAKNVVSLGGAYHFDDTDETNDLWHSGLPSALRASYGPAEDGRIKPDLTNFFDQVVTPQLDDTGQGEDFRLDFGGTSTAAPITCGHFGLFFQMWADDPDGDGLGIFHNELTESTCNPATQNCVFRNRAHSATAKAMMINTAVPYCFNDGAQCPLSDLGRDKQGWGKVNVARLYLLRNKFPVIIDEGQRLDTFPGGPNPESVSYPILVGADAYALRATLVYVDSPGTVSSSQHAIIDLDLKVESPGGASFYWGNNGLRDGTWSTAGGVSDTDAVDNVENVFVPDPAAGTWTVQVLADVVPLTAFFALVVSVDEDCNQNQCSDADDIRAGASVDCNDDGVPDECEPDCNGNDVADECDISSGTSQDCNGNGVPDECDISGGTSQDCNNNNIPDECDISSGYSQDCNSNGVPDECDNGCCNANDCQAENQCCNFSCRECCDHPDCGSNEVCCNFSCVTGECCDDSDCTFPPRCRPWDNVCVLCYDDSQCGSGCCCKPNGTCFCGPFACGQF